MSRSRLGAREVRVYSVATGNRDIVRRVAREILENLLGMTPGSLVIEQTELGKPFLRDFPQMHYSSSHAEDASLIAVTTVGTVGVDIEKIRTVPNAAVIVRRFFPKSEMEKVLGDPQRVDESFMLAWTRAEASVKVRGASVWDMATLAPGVEVVNIPTVPGYVGAVAVDGCRDWEVTQVEYPLEK